MKTYSFSETKNRYIKYLTFSGLFPILMLFILSLTHSDLMASNPSIKKQYISAAVNSLLGFLVMYPILKYCAYKKGGNNWLTFDMIITGIALIWLIVPMVLLLIAATIFGSYPFAQLILERLNTQLTASQPGSFFVTVLLLKSCYGYIIYRYLRIASQLRKNNVLHRYKQTLKNKSYKEAFLLIDSSQNLQELRSSYSNLNQSYPELHLLLRLKKKRKIKFFSIRSKKKLEMMSKV